MTIEELQKLTARQKRILIGNLCGIWLGEGEEVESLPDYLADLNAMHRAVMETRRKGSNWYMIYHRCLEHICCLHNSSVAFEESIYPSEATANQRADAFLLTDEVILVARQNNPLVP